MRKKMILGSLICCTIMQQTFCGMTHERTAAESRKDLSEQMDAMQIYQQTIGEDLHKKDWEGALLMLNGLDSVMKISSRLFEKHHRLKQPFGKFYNNRLKKPIRELRKALQNEDFAQAEKNYGLLVKRCNSCHSDNDVLENAHY